LPCFGDVAQFAVGPVLLATGDSRFLIGHGLLRGFDPAVFERCLRDAGILKRIPAFKRCVSEPLAMSALLLNAMLLGTGIGRILVSTSSAPRLRKFVSEAKAMFEEMRCAGAGDAAADFSNVVRCYFAAHNGRHP
jgi:hypothetical protein